MRASWEEAFSQKALQTGRYLFERHLVQSISSVKPLPRTIRATVWDGTECQAVQIDLEGNLLKSCSCSCPYNDDKNPCAHIAAVLLTLEEKGIFLELGEPTTEDGKTWLDVLNGLSQDELRKFLLEAIELHPELRNRLILQKNRRITTYNYQLWRKKINHLLKQYKPDEYWSLWEVVHQLEDFLETELQDIQSFGTWEDQADFTALVFQICCDAILSQRDCYYTSDDFDLQDVLFRCNDVWINLIQDATPEQVDRLKQWFLSHPKYSWYFLDAWETISDDHYPED